MIHLIDYADLWHIDCLNTGVINSIFRQDIASGKWDGARHVRVLDNLLTSSMPALLTRPQVVAHLEGLDMAALMLLPDTFEVLCQSEALSRLERLSLGVLHSSITSPITPLLAHMKRLTHLSVREKLSPQEADLIAARMILPYEPPS